MNVAGSFLGPPVPPKKRYISFYLSPVFLAVFETVSVFDPLVSPADPGAVVHPATNKIAANASTMLIDTSFFILDITVFLDSFLDS